MGGGGGALGKRRSGLASIVALILGTSALAFPPAASAAANASWSGADTSSTRWSQADNWAADAVPSAAIGTLTFGDLGASCDAGSGSSACYLGLDDLGPVTLNQLSINNSFSYELAPADLAGDTITINADSSCGLSFCGLDAWSYVGQAAGQAPPDISIPIVLGNGQTWAIDGGENPDYSDGGLGLEVDQVSGSSSPLSLYFSDGGILYATTLNTGRITATAGNGSGSGVVVLEPLTNPGNAPVYAEVSSAGLGLDNGMTLLVASPDTTSGPISVQSGGSTNTTAILIGQGSVPESTIAVTGSVNLDPETATAFEIDDNGSVAGADFSQLTATGEINFDGSALFVQQGQNAAGGCANLASGDTVVLASAAGGLSGTIDYTDVNGNDGTLEPGQTSAPIPIGSCPVGNTAAAATLTYGPNEITATVVGSAPTPGTQTPQISGVAVSGSTLTATSPGSWQGTGPFTYTYQWFECFDNYCSQISGATGSTYLLTSQAYDENVKVEVTAHNAFGTATADSNLLGPVTNPGVYGGRPVISGTAMVGDTLTTSAGSWIGSPSLTYSWQSCPTSALPCASTAVVGTSYTLTASDVGHFLQVMVCPGATYGDCQSSSTVGPVLASPQELIAALELPTGRHAATVASRSGSLTGVFTAPTPGSLIVILTTRVTTRYGKHKTSRVIRIGRGALLARNTSRMSMTFYLSYAGRALLKKKRNGIIVTATEKFRQTGADWTQVTQRFRL